MDCNTTANKADNKNDVLSWDFSTFHIGREYEQLVGDIKLIKSYNTSNFDSTIYFYNGENLIKKYNLNPNVLPMSINVNVVGVDNLKIMVKDNKAVSGGTSFGLIDFRLCKQQKNTISVILNGNKLSFDQPSLNTLSGVVNLMLLKRSLPLR